MAQYEQGNKSMAQIERDLGITDGLLGKWQEDLQRAPNETEAFPGQGNLTDSQERIRQLERENAQLRQEKDTLKKVLAI